jgi:hypothetical protein
VSYNPVYLFFIHWIVYIVFPHLLTVLVFLCTFVCIYSVKVMNIRLTHGSLKIVSQNQIVNCRKLNKKKEYLLVCQVRPCLAWRGQKRNMKIKQC